MRAGEDRFLVRQPPDCSRSLRCLIIGWLNYDLRLEPFSRRAGIRLRYAKQEKSLKPQATSDRQRALPDPKRNYRQTHGVETINSSAG
jgi:hypothetical protein